MSGQNCKHGLPRDECARCFNEFSIPVDAYLDAREDRAFADLRASGGTVDAIEASMRNLAKCPFCGNRQLIVSEHDCGDNVREHADIVVCGDCGARGPWGDNETDAMDLWNRRDGIV